MIAEIAPLELRSTSLFSVLLLGAGAFVGLLWRRQAKPTADVQIELKVDEEGVRRTLRLRPPITFGRGADAALRVVDPHASRLHAILDIEDGFAFVEDLGSRNGTLVNARPISGRVRLAPGDEIGLGRVRVIFSGEVPWT